MMIESILYLVVTLSSVVGFFSAITLQKHLDPPTIDLELRRLLQLVYQGAMVYFLLIGVACMDLLLGKYAVLQFIAITTDDGKVPLGAWSSICFTAVGAGILLARSVQVLVWPDETVEGRCYNARVAHTNAHS